MRLDDKLALLPIAAARVGRAAGGAQVSDVCVGAAVGAIIDSERHRKQRMSFGSASSSAAAAAERAPRAQRRPSATMRRFARDLICR